MKSLIWLGSSRADLRHFPAQARRLAGYQLWRLQLGLEPTDWKPISTVGPGVREIRIHVDLEVRVFYLAKLEDGVFVLHAFQKQGQKTAKRDIQIASERLRQLMVERRKGRR